MMMDKQQIIGLETDFWTAMRDKHPPSAQALIAKQCLVTGPMGTMRIDPEQFAELTREGDWRLDAFELRDVEVLFPNEATAIVTYKVHETGEMHGGPMDMEAADATVWVQEDGAWKVALHTETILQPHKQPEKQPEPA
jgi:ketosteroid isomerase-like protein